MGYHKVGTDLVLGGREASAPVATPSTPWRVLKPEPLANPLLGKWLCVLKDARPCRIFQCRCLSNLVGANSHRRSLSLLLTPRENCSCPKATRYRARSCCPRSRVAPLLAPPLGGLRRVRARAFKSDSKLPPQSHSQLAFARPNIANGSARMKDPSLPQAGPFTASFQCSQFSCSFSPTKRLTFSTIDPISCGFRRNASAPASRASTSFAVPDIIMIRRS